MNPQRGRRRLLTLAIALVAVSPHGVPARAAASAVNEVGTAFQPAELRIGVNDRVVWTNRSTQSHTVTFPDQDLHPRCDPDAPALLRVGCQGAGETAERMFTSPGTYSYYCKLHQNVDPPMRGVVVVGAATTTLATTTSTLPGKSSTTTTTLRATSSTTATTRPLATSSTVITSTTTTTTEATSVLLPGEPPPFTDETSSAANKSRGSKDRSDSGTVGLIVGLLLAVSAGGGLLLWRLRPGRP
jgi:plastocyanin